MSKMEKIPGVNLTYGNKELNEEYAVKGDTSRCCKTEAHTVADESANADIKDGPRSEGKEVKTNKEIVKNETATATKMTDTTSNHNEKGDIKASKPQDGSKQNFGEKHETNEDLDTVQDNAKENGFGTNTTKVTSDDDVPMHSASEASASQSDCEPPIHELSLQFKCGQCSETYDTIADLQAHKSTDHTKPGKTFQCDQCHRTFKANYRLLVHKRTHTGERPFNCADCSASFMTKQVLENHVRIHLGDRPFKCSTCDASFIQKAGLRRHMYTHESRQPHECDLCDATFPTELLLAKHSYNHDCDNPVKKCHTCDLEFASSSELRMHSSLHLGRKVYKCELCESSFALSRTLRNHMRKHGNAVKEEKPFVCEVCQKDFTRDSDLSRHKKMVHVVRSNEKC